MTKPDDTILRVITEESVQPRREAQEAHLAAADPDALPVARADLLYLWSDYRKEYLDFAALANPLGHAHPMVANAVADHRRYYGFTAPQGRHLLRWPVEYARQLSQRFTGADEEPRRVLYCEGEREAARLAVALATARTGSPDVAVVGDGHHWLGRTRGYPWNHDPAGVMRDGGPGAVLIDPVDRRGRVIGRGDARRWILAARGAGVPVIYDESITGFGRLGSMWGQERTGLTADLTVLGGAAGGGWPFGAVVAPPGFFPADPEGLASSQAGHPVICCAGAVTLDVVGLGVLEYMEETVPILERGLDELVAQFGHHLTGHHGAGLLRGLNFHGPDQARRFTLDCRTQGIYVAPPVGPTVILAPPLITSTNEMTRGVDLLAATLLTWDDQDVT